MGQEIAPRHDYFVATGPGAQAASQSHALMNTIQQLALKGGEGALTTIEKLVELQERFAKTEAKRQFDDAFACAKGEIAVVAKDGQVKYKPKANQQQNQQNKGRPQDDGDGEKVDYKYATLAAIYDAAVPALSKYGLSYDFDIKQELLPGERDGEKNWKITVGCTVTHASGHSKRVEMFGPPEDGGKKPLHKAIASAVTIFSRLTLKAALGIAEREDPDDTDGGPSEATQEAAPDVISAEQVAELKDLADGTEEAFLNWMKVSNIESIPAGDYEKARSALVAKRAAAKQQPRK